MAHIKKIKDLVSIQITTAKLMAKTSCCGRNMWVFLSARDKLKIITSAKPAATERAFEE